MLRCAFLASRTLCSKALSAPALANNLNHTLVATDPAVQRLVSPVAAWTRSFACRWDAANPQKVTVEYDPADLESFITLADALEEAFPRIVIEGNEGASGAFEVSTEGNAVFSKLATGGLTPDIQTLIDSITKHIAVSESTGASRTCT